MAEQTPQSTDAPLGDAIERLRNLRRTLLHLHKVLLEDERAAYERVHGQVNSGELLQLLISHEQFAWLHAISELVVEIDEMFDADEPVTTAAAESVLASAAKLLTPAETGSEFERKYFAALQREPDAVLAHREARALLKE
ncbi:MAG TPA: hypothetical protein VF779_05650 [Pyrinomonadaceae bacterium]|jgi:hypothetical protein